MELQKEDIPALDFLLNKMVERNDQVYGDHLKEFKKYSDSENKIIWSEFKRLIYFFEEFNCSIVYRNDMDSAWLSPNSRTLQFKHAGGFKNAHSDLEDKKRIAELEIRKTEVDLNLAEKTLKEFPRTKWFARVGFIIAVLLSLKEIGIWLWQLLNQ